MSEVDLYAAEAKFNESKAEYIVLMNSLQTSCLKDHTTTQCQKAAELNASMQNSLLQISNLLKKSPRSLPKQQELLNLSDQLQQDQSQLLTEVAANDDIVILANMNYTKWLAWWLSAITVFFLIMYTVQNKYTS
jgi:hypothetical protein